MDEWPTMNFYTHPPSLKQQKVKHTHNFHRERERERAGFVSFFSRYTKEADYFGSKNLVIRWGRTATFLSFLCCWLFYRIYKISLAPFFFFFFFFRKWRASAAASLNEARARTLAGAGIFFSFLFPFFFFFFLYKSTRREKMRIECRKQIHRYFIPPYFELEPLIIFYLFV